MNSTLLAKLSALTRQIEANLEWGDRQSWTNKDFTTLSESIFQKTGKQISVTTLKRIWGRAQLVATPSQATLDILAEFAGFEDWRSFDKAFNRPEPKAKLEPRYALVGGVSFLALAVLVMLGISSFQSQEETPVHLEGSMAEPEVIQFEHEKIAVGYPNTVYFRYNVGDTPYDSIQIQQSWDKGRRITLDKPKGLASSTYYAAGYYSTKLLVNNEILVEKDLYIPTQGWQAMIGGNVPQLIYPQQEQYRHGESIGLAPSILSEMNQHPGSSLWLSNLLPTPSINSTQLDLETEFRMTATEKSICQNIWIVVTGSKDVFRFQLSIPGCVGDLMFFLNMDMISGRNKDLSAFGINPDEWTNFKLKVRDLQLIASINGEPVFAHELSDDIGAIGGVQYIFEGLGEIRMLEMKDKTQSIDLIESPL